MRSLTTADNLHAAAARETYCPPVSDTVLARVLAASVAKTLAIPAGARFVLVSATADVFVRYGGSAVTAAVPSGDISDGTAPELNPVGRRIPPDVTHIALVAPAACTVTLSFYES